MFTRILALSVPACRPSALGSVLLVCALAACSSSTDVVDGSTDRDASSKVKLACPQRPNSDGTDDDCVALKLPRKLDCEDEDSMNDALTAGCKREDPTDEGDYDVCCPKTVSGTAPEVQQVDCKQKAGSDQDDDCSSFPGTPRKLDCDAGQTASALAAGCVRQASGASDVCCPLTVSGMAKSSGASSSSGN